MESIVLAGGFGTRLRSEVKDLPKSMAIVFGEPFLNYQLRYLKRIGVQKVILAVGYLKDSIINYYQSSFEGLEIAYSIEEEPLGTGGAIARALHKCKTDNVLVLNGDTMMMFPLQELFDFHKQNKAHISVLLKSMNDFERYGSVKINEKGRITHFEEKKWMKEGLINSGVYLIDKSWFFSKNFPDKFSFEKEVLEAKVSESLFYGYSSGGYFIDIGIPEDYITAQRDFARLFPLRFDYFTTLFLDRDGVINRHLPNDYVTDWSRFEFLPNVFNFLKFATTSFEYIFVVTNQQGIGKGKMTLESLTQIHLNMQNEIEKNGGRIDAIYFAPDIDNPSNILRKPKTGMAMQAKNDFPDVDFKKSIMIGDSDSDIEFGNNIEAFTIRIANSWDSKSNKTFVSLAQFFEYIV